MARPTLFSHPKFAKLSARLKSRAIALGSLELLWEAAYASGDPVIGDAEAVEEKADWKGPRGELATALKQAGFLELDELRQIYLIHDLEDHAPDYVLKRWEREAKRRASGHTLRSVRQQAAAARWATESDGSSRSERLALARTRGTHTAAEWTEMVDFFRCCVKCGAQSLLFKDHILPIYLGGSDAISNLQPLCRRCNNAKGPDATDYRSSRLAGRQPPSSWALTPANGGQTPATVRRTPASVLPPAPAPITDPDRSGLTPANGGQTSDDWTPWRWKELFGREWAKLKQKLTYAMASDSVGCAKLGDLLEQLTPEERREAQAKAGAMFAAFLADDFPALVKAQHPFAWFVQRFGALVVEVPAPGRTPPPLRVVRDPGVTLAPIGSASEARRQAAALRTQPRAEPGRPPTRTEVTPPPSDASGAS